MPVSEYQYIKAMNERFPTMRKWRTLAQYDGLLGLSIFDIASQAIQTPAGFHWTDLCCGSFSAGKQLQDQLLQSYSTSANTFSINGVDLDPLAHTALPVIPHDASTYPIIPNTTLLTCLFGLKYIKEVGGYTTGAILHWINDAPAHCIIAFNYPVLQHDALTEYLQNTLGDQMSARQYSFSGETVFTIQIVKPENMPIIHPL